MVLKSEHLSSEKVSRLKNWLDDSAFELLVTVLENEAFELEVNAANHLAIGTQGGEKAAEWDKTKAERISFAIETMQRLRSAKVFKIHTAVPTPFKS